MHVTFLLWLVLVVASYSKSVCVPPDSVVDMIIITFVRLIQKNKSIP